MTTNSHLSMPPDIPTPDFEHYRFDHVLTAADKATDYITCRWQNGGESKFHFIWLFDNCACALCIDPDSRERIRSFREYPEFPEPVGVSVNSAGALTVDWGNSHVSLYHPGWLKTFDYSRQSRADFSIRPQLWDGSAGQNMPWFKADQVMQDDMILYELLQSIKHKGIALVNGLGLEQQDIINLTERFCIIRDMNWGRIFEIKNNRSAAYLSNAHYALDAHSDAATREYIPGMQMFQCVSNQCSGGESFWVDGFRIAEDIRQTKPEYWELLTQVNWEQANRSNASHYRWQKPIICLDAEGYVCEIRDTYWLREPLRADFELIPKVYQAYRYWCQLKADKKYQISAKLDKGQVALIDNRRVLHGRYEIRKQSGERCVRTIYSERDEYLSAIRMLERKYPHLNTKTASK